MTRILVVDDKKDDRYMLETLLEGSGYEVITAGNGDEALLLARIELPDLIVTDIMMPGMDGFTLCKEWKKDEQLKDIPLIFYTAIYTSAHDEEFAMGLGADRFIQKPQEPEGLVAILREIIKQHDTGELVASQPPLGEEMEFFRQHDEILYKKLESYVVQLKDALAYARKLNEELEQRVQERTAELKKQNEELEEFNDVFVGRELRMIELKEQMAKLKAEIKALKEKDYVQ